MTLPPQLSPRQPAARHLIERAAERLQGHFGLNGQTGPGLPDAPPDAAEPMPGRDPPPPVVPPAARAEPAALQAVLPAETERQGSSARLGLIDLEAAGLRVGGPTRSRVSEEYQVFSAQLMQLMQATPAGAAPANLLMITSAQPGEGKSFTSINLAASLARTRNVKTLLIDGDPKQNSLSVLLQLSGRRGLFDLAAEPSATVEPMIVPTAIDALSVLPIGTVSQTHGMTHRVASLLAQLARQYDDRILIFDAPPCLATSDPSTLAPQVGFIAMVVEAERTQRREVEHALNLVRACPNIVMILNKLQFGGRTGFGAYGYYGA